MNLKKLLNSSLFLAPVLVIAQQVSTPNIIEAIVLDAKNQPIIGVMVKINDGKYDYSVKTDEKGYFKKKLYGDNKTIEVNLSKLSYENLSGKAEINTLQKFTLKEADAKQIEEVVIKNNGIKTEGDKTTYDANFFSNKKEDKVGDLLKKLPGVDVDKDGQVKFNGKLVNKLTVEDENFFGGSTGLGVKSLPANAISKFEFADNVKTSNIITNSSDTLVLNLKLKEEKKEMVFGDLLLYGNSTDRYKTGANLFYFSKKEQINWISDFNNVNENLFTGMDYIGLLGADLLTKESAYPLLKTLADNVESFIETTDKLGHKHFFNALGYNKNIWNDTYKLNIFNINNFSNIQSKYVNSIDFQDPKFKDFSRKEEFLYQTEAKTNDLNISLRNINNQNIETFFNLSYRYNQSNTLSNKDYFFSTNNQFNNSLQNHNQQSWTSFFDLNYRLSDEHKQGFSIGFTLSDKIYNIDQQTSLIDLIHPILKLKQLQNPLLQTLQQGSKQTNVELRHFYDFLDYHSLSLKSGIINYRESIDNNFEAEKASLFSNQMILDKNDHFTKLNYRLRYEKWLLSMEFKYLFSHANFSSDVNNANFSQSFLLPKIKIDYKSSNYGNIELNFERSTREPGISRYYTGNYMRNSANLIMGINTPANALTDDINIKYTKNAQYAGCFISASLGRTNFIQDYINDINTTTLQQSNRLVLANNTGHRNNAYIRLEQQILGKKISLILNTNISENITKSRLNNQDIKAQSVNSTIDFSLKSRYKKAPNFEIFNILRFSNYQSEVANNNIRFYELNLSLDYDVTEDIKLKTNYTWSQNLTDNTTFNQSFIKLDYTVNSSLKIGAACNNIFNSLSKNTVFNNGITINLQQIYQMPRFYYLGCTYKI